MTSINYKEYCVYDKTSRKFEAKVPLPLNGWYTAGEIISLGLYDTLDLAKEAANKYFNKVRPIYTSPSPTNLGKDVKGAVIYAREMEIKCLKNELEELKTILKTLLT